MPTLRRKLSIACACAALAAGAAACGGGGDGGGGGGGQGLRGGPLVDQSLGPPYVNSLEVEPGSDAILLGTNTGLFRIEPGGREPVPVDASLSREGASLKVGAEIIFAATKPGTLLGSGHPDDDAQQPEFLGVIRSTDAGKTWTTVSGEGEIDLHAVRYVDGRLFGFDASGLLMVSDDEGETFRMMPPPDLVLDLAVSRKDPKVLVASSEKSIFRSEQGGRNWEMVAEAPFARLASAPDGTLFRADADGQTHVSRDEGRTWEPLGKIGGEPWALTVPEDDRLLAALIDGSVTESRDGGRSWKVLTRG